MCPDDSTKLYDGSMSAPSSNHKGGGTNILCLHPDPQYPKGYSDLAQPVSALHGVEYIRNDNDILITDNYQDAACAVCQHNTATSVYVQWGRTKCSNGHITQYSGLVMASQYEDQKIENICVDLERVAHRTSNGEKDEAAKLFTSEFNPNPKAPNEKVYTKGRELACAVCAPMDLPSPPACKNIPGWTDLYGDDCSTSYYSDGCVPEDTVAHANKDGMSAKHACCACGGGKREKVPPPPPGGYPQND